jgi:hypothetical protein
MEKKLTRNMKKLLISTKSLVKRGYQTEADVIQAILDGEIDKELLERTKRTKRQTKVQLSSRILRTIAEKYE